MSLRSFHLLFILLVIFGADLFAVWAVWYWNRTGDGLMLGMGIAVAAGGLGLIFYAMRLRRRFDAEHIR